MIFDFNPWQLDVNVELTCKGAIICPFCKFGIMAWFDGKIDENGEEIKDKPK